MQPSTSLAFRNSSETAAVGDSEDEEKSTQDPGPDWEEKLQVTVR